MRRSFHAAKMPFWTANPNETILKAGQTNQKRVRNINIRSKQQEDTGSSLGYLVTSRQFPRC